MMDNNLVDDLIEIARQISRGEIPSYQHNECYTSGAFDLLLVDAEDAAAFDLLGRICARYGSVKEAGNGLEGYYYLLTQIARQSNTTEMPSGMRAIINEDPELSRDLRDWYRVSS